MRAMVAALVGLVTLSLADPIAAQTVEFPTDCTEHLSSATIFIAHDCGEWASITIVGNIVIREPWSGVIPASRAARIRANREGGTAPAAEATRTPKPRQAPKPRRTPTAEPTSTSRQTPTTDPLDDILALDVSGGSSDNPDCEDFSTQRQAQAYFDARGWSKDDDPYRLDQGGAPGVPCEDLP